MLLFYLNHCSFDGFIKDGDPWAERAGYRSGIKGEEDKGDRL